MATYLYHLFIAVDQLANALLFGHAEETLSARAWRTEQDGKVFGKFFRPFIDVLALIVTLGRDERHCYRAYRAEFNRHQNHPHYKTDPKKA